MIQQTGGCQEANQKQVADLENDDMFQHYREVTVYFRLPSKRTVKTKLPSIVVACQLFQIIQNQLKINPAQAAIFYRGMRIQPDQGELQQILTLEQKCILHVHNRQNALKNKLIITITPYDCGFEELQPLTLQVYPHEVIGKCLKGMINFEDNLVLVQSGRKLDIDKRFQDELIEDGSTIILTSFARQAKIMAPPCLQSRQKNETPQLQQQKQQQQQPEEHDPNMSTPMIKKSVSWSTPDPDSFGGFKKKQKPSIYKSMRMKDGKEIIWESDSSSDVTQKDLAKKLAKRKHKHGQEESKIKEQSEQHHMVIFSEEEDEIKTEIFQPKFTKKQKMDLSKEMKKLLFSQNLPRETEVSKLQSPPSIMCNDFFMDEVEEVLVNPHNEPEKEFDMKDRLKGSLSLRESIGKSRGTFVPMIPTRDLDLDEDMDDQF